MRYRSFWNQILFHTGTNFPLQVFGQLVADLVTVHFVPGGGREAICTRLGGLVEVVSVRPALDVEFLRAGLLVVVASEREVAEWGHVVHADLRLETIAGHGLECHSRLVRGAKLH